VSCPIAVPQINAHLGLGGTIVGLSRSAIDVEANPMTNDNTPFPLHQWFDLSRRILKDDRRSCEDQMALYALKEGGA
jgi:hypothetical protein